MDKEKPCASSLFASGLVKHILLLGLVWYNRSKKNSKLTGEWE